MTRILRAFSLALAAMVFAGCNGSGGTGGSSATDGTPTLYGSVYGGQQPVSNSTVTLYAAGSGLNSASVLATGTTDANGNFSLSSYVCPTPTSQMYIAAADGNPGLGSGTNNTAIHLMAALGACDSLPGFVNVDEVTTVAAAYALNGFIGPNGCVDCAGGLPTSVNNVRSSASNTLGLSHAMLTAARLASVGSGTASPPLPSESACSAATPPVDCGAEEKLDSLANSLAACVNTTSSSSTECIELFDCATPGATFSSGVCTVASGITPASDTLQAILYIARNPGQVSMSGVNDVSTKNVVFSPALTAAPTDWTLMLNITGGGLNAPLGVAIDAAGNVWTTSAHNNTVNEFSNNGAALSGSGYTGGGLNFPDSIAIDAAGNVWTASANNNTVNEFSNNGAALSGSGYTGGGLYSPGGIAIDAAGNVWTASESNNTVNEFSNSGAALSGSGYTGGGLNAPHSIAIDAAGNVWTASYNNNTVNEFSNSGAALSGSGYTGGGLNEPDSIAIDAAGNVWTASYNNSTVNEFSNSGAALSGSGYTGGGLNEPDSIAIDAAGNVWTASFYNNTVNEFSNSSAALSGSGYTDGGLSGLVGIAIDAAGNVWVTNFYNNSVTEIIGAAAPTRTPLVNAINQGFTP